MKILLVVVCLLCGEVVARAGFYSGNDMQGFCANKSALMYGFVAGAIDKSDFDFRMLTQQVIDELEEQRIAKMRGDDRQVDRATAIIGVLATKLLATIKRYCVPESATVEQAGDVFCKYLKDRPAERQKSAAELLVLALNDAWPCKQQ
jgi:hypothetical protein